MTDPTPTRAEVERIATQLEKEEGCGLPQLAADMLRALRERAEAARRRGDILAEGWQIADEGRIEAEAALTAARRAEAAAWNDAIEAAAGAAEEWDTFGPTVRAIRALRRAAPTEGEA